MLSREEILSERRMAPSAALRRQVSEIIDAVRSGKDRAVRALTLQFDGVDVPQTRVAAGEIRVALDEVPGETRLALSLAAARVRAVCAVEKPEPRHSSPATQGVHVRLLREPLGRVAVYVPAGRAPLPSSAIMGVVPAQVAGVSEIAVLTPPGPDGRADRTTLAACALLGVEEVHLMGGAQAVAAAAYGTETVRRVDKIVGPGNAFVTEAKRQVYGVVGIDGLNGPSEVLVWAESPAPAEQIARDLLAQAEHDPESWAVLVSSSAQVIEAVQAAMRRVAAAARVEELLARPGVGAVQVSDPEQAAEIVAEFGPEHLELWGAATAWADRVRAAGATFIACPTPLGDYAAGGNHILPTGGSARFASPLGVEDFMRRRSETHVIGDASEVAKAAARLAAAEGLTQHLGALESFLEVTAPWADAQRSR